MKGYVSPKVEFKAIKLGENIADTCWGNHGTEKDYFYDYSGRGYIRFRIKAGSCTLNTNTVNIYYEYVPKDEESKAYDEFFLAVKNAGAESANHWKGTIITTDPDPSWS